MDHFYCIAQGKKKKSLFQVPKAKEKWLMDHPFERGAGEDRWVISDKKKKTGDQIWNEEQHSRVEFMLVMKFDRWARILPEVSIVFQINQRKLFPR